MMGRDLLGLATAAPRRHGLRSILSLGGIAVGVAAVLVLTAFGEGAREYVVDEFVGLGTNVIAVIPGKVETTGALGAFGGTTRDLTIDDAIAAARRCAAVRRAAPVSLGEAPLEFGAAGRNVPVIGTTHDYLEIRKFEVAAGRSLPRGDPHRGERVCLIGRTVQENVFGNANPLGATVRVGQWRFRVVGVLGAKGSVLGIDMDDVVLVPVRTAMRMFDRTSLFRILVQAGSPTEVETARAELHAVLLDRHDGEEDFTLMTQGAMLETFNSILGALTSALAAIAAISLLVAGIGIMNVMLVSVAERTEEIGLMKALGARPGQILRLFLTEAVVLAAAGAAVGVGLGAVAMAATTSIFPELPARLHAVWLALAIGLALVAGGLFGVLPARRAARVEAARALGGRV
ncbi:MAG: ABC transporter permease [Candidatus Krumholzibacteriia bacterium]